MTLRRRKEDQSEETLLPSLKKLANGSTRAERWIQGGLAAIVAGVWIAVLFLPVSSHIQVGVQAAMMLVLGRFMGVSITKKGNGGSDD